MFRKVLLPSLLLLLSACALSQTPESMLQRFVSEHPPEKVYLHFDREQYITGETAWFKVYMYSDYQPDTITTSLTAELLGLDGKVIAHSVMPVLLGTATGYFDIPDSISSGRYTVRCFSPSMLNAAGNISYQYIQVVFPPQKNYPSPGTVNISFFPEGGNMVAGLNGTIAFKATLDGGMPADIRGRIFNHANEQVTVFNTTHDGMGMFDLLPKPGEAYYATIENDPAKKRFTLPEVALKGISLTMIPHPQGHYFEIHEQDHINGFQAAYMIGQMQHHVVFRQEFKPGTSLQGVINTTKLHSGILHVTIFNKDNIPLAERLCFVDNGEYRLKTFFNMDTLRFDPRSNNLFTLKLMDTIRGSFSYSVSDAAFETGSSRSNNIISSLLLTEDIRGYVHRPSFYFSSENDSVRNALDLLMMTNGWRRFKWTELNSIVNKKPSFKNDPYITLDGFVKFRDAKKLFADKQLLLWLITADSTRSLQMTRTDLAGHFRIDSLLFFGKSQLIFSDTRGKKNLWIDVSLSPDSLHQAYPLPMGFKAHLLAEKDVRSYAEQFAPAYQSMLQAKGLLMENVLLKKTKKKNLLAELDEKYTSANFSGDANRVIDLVNNDEASSYANIFDYLRSRVPGIQVMNEGFDYEVYYRQQATISSLGNPQMIIFLDEIQTEPSVIATIPASQIALVKVYSSFAGASGNAMGGVLALYTKKGSDMNGMETAADIKTYNGYTITKEFYTPDYSIPANREGADNRITLQWDPAIFINGVNPVIPIRFYTGDNTRAVKVVAEGMTIDGRFVSFEKIVNMMQKGF